MQTIVYSARTDSFTLRFNQYTIKSGKLMKVDDFFNQNIADLIAIYKASFVFSCLIFWTQNYTLTTDEPGWRESFIFKKEAASNQLAYSGLELVHDDREGNGERQCNNCYKKDWKDRLYRYLFFILLFELLWHLEDVFLCVFCLFVGLELDKKVKSYVLNKA